MCNAKAEAGKLCGIVANLPEEKLDFLGPGSSFFGRMLQQTEYFLLLLLIFRCSNW